MFESFEKDKDSRDSSVDDVEKLGAITSRF